jgi:hypothetical protein
MLARHAGAARAHPATRPSQLALRISRPVRSSARPVRAMAAGEKTVLVPIGNGSEEMEAIITVDVLRRAGAKVVVASVEPQLEVVCSRGVRIVADMLMSDVAADSYDLIACPVSAGVAAWQVVHHRGRAVQGALCRMELLPRRTICLPAPGSSCSVCRGGRGW